MPSLFQSISSFFTSQRGDSSHLRRDQAMVSVDDAFTVPPDTEYVSTSTTYTYPPPAQGGGSYDTVPQSYAPSDLRPSLSAGPSGTSRITSLLPIHHTPLSPLPNYPPLQQTWSRLRSWLDDQYPELADTLNWGIQPPDLAHLELQLGFALPPAVRESYLIVNGQEAESSAGCSEGLFFGLTLLPFEDVVDEWRFWREVDDDPATGANTELREDMRSIPPGWIRREYSQRGWLPLVADKAGNYIGIDMNPDERGSIGQVIIFGRDFDTKVVMWRGEGEGGWARWLASFVEELESGEGFVIGMTETSEGSDDGVGYESYFFDGSTAKSQGGDGGGGGLRLTGEYRGWTVLEALADRSMRRWIEAGVMPQPTNVDDTSPSPTAGQLAGLDTNTSSSSPRSTEWRSVSHLNWDPSSSHAHTSKLSITMVPAPLPVDVPTERDLLPSPTFSSPTETSQVYDTVDEESRMREVDRTTPVQDSYPPSVREAMLVPLPSSDIVSPSKPFPPIPTIDTQSEPPIFPASDNFDSPTLFSASTPIGIPPVSATMNTTSVPAAVLSSRVLTPTPVDSSESNSSGSQVVKEEPQPTVRLVGGGGTMGDVLLVDDATETPDASGLSKKNLLEMSGSSGKRKTEAV